MRFEFGLIGMSLAATACIAQPVGPRNGQMAETVRTYSSESRERVIEAARAVLQQSDPSDFEFSETLSGFVGLRRFMVYAVLTTATGREKWDFQTEPKGKGIRALIAISEAGVNSQTFSSQSFEQPLLSPPLYRLFWSRVDYMLGQRADWVSCAQAEAEASASGMGGSALGGLCGPTSGGRAAPAPAPLQRSIRGARP